MATKVPKADIQGNDLFERIWEKANFGTPGTTLKSIRAYVTKFSDSVLESDEVTAHARYLATECKLQAKWVASHNTPAELFELGLMFRELELEVSGNQAMIAAYSRSYNRAGDGSSKRHAEARKRDAEIQLRAEEMYRSSKSEFRRRTKYIAEHLYKEYGEDERDDGTTSKVKQSDRLYPLILMRPLTAIVSKVRKRLEAEKDLGRG